MIIFEVALKLFATFVVEFTVAVNCVMITIPRVAVIVTLKAVVAVSNAIITTTAIPIVVVDAFSY